jgi:hypothetical protein
MGDLAHVSGVEHTDIRESNESAIVHRPLYITDFSERDFAPVRAPKIA